MNINFHLAAGKSGRVGRNPARGRRRISGNLQEDLRTATQDSVWDYTYDAEDRLVTMQTRTDVIGTGRLEYSDARRLEFKYDYLGRRVEKIVRDGYNGSSFATVATDLKLLYDGWNLLFEFNALTANTKVRAYLWGLDLSGTMQGAGGVGGLLRTWTYTSGVVTGAAAPLADAMGNIHGWLDSSTGTTIAAYEYDAFGNTLRETGTYAASNPFRFSTKYTDLETGLVYYGLRYYSPTLGRFINKDPIEEQGGLNLYGFCGNNGVNKWDMLGMKEQTLWSWLEGLFGGSAASGGGSSGGVGSGNSSSTGDTYRDGRGNEWVAVNTQTGKLSSRTDWVQVSSGNSVSVLGAFSGFIVDSNGGRDSADDPSRADAPNNAATPGATTETTTNWSKGIVGATNVVRSGFKVVGGVQQIVAGVPVIIAGHATGTVTPWSLVAEAGGYALVANGAKDVFGGAFLAKRGITQLGEARNADTSWEWQNFAGLLPFGGHYDDPGEATRAMQTIKEMTWWEKLGEVFTGP